MTELVTKPKTFAEIADDLSAWSESLEMATTDEDRLEIQAQIDRIGAELVTKTDSLASVLRRMDSDVEVCKAEEKRLQSKRKAHERASQWLREYVMRTMKENGWKRLQTPLNTISIVQNGGVQPLQVTENADLLPDDMCGVGVSMPALLWKELLDTFITRRDLREIKVSRWSNNAAIREALRQPCDHCGGTKEDGERLAICPVCNGSGTRQVPGAKLLERGERLDIR